MTNTTLHPTFNNVGIDGGFVTSMQDAGNRASALVSAKTLDQNLNVNPNATVETNILG